MPRSKKYIHLFLTIFFLVLCQFAFGSHLKGGEISIKRISKETLTYQFTLITYTENNRANDEQNEVNFCFGDGSGIFKAPRIGQPVDIGNGTLRNVYIIEYTYPANALSYKVSVAIPNRNAGVRNISSSDSVPFYVETVFSTNSGLGLNNTPIFLNPAVDLTAQVGQLFIHNPNAIDFEGDSLAYRLSVSKYGNQDKCGDANRGMIAPGFVQPNEVSATPSSFTIDPLNGDVKWDVPQEVGRYNLAFIVEEWRNGLKISETVRDMQVEVQDANNNRPLLTAPEDICVTAGDFIRKVISAEDQPSSDGARIDPIDLISTSNIYENGGAAYIKPPYATFTNKYNVASPQSTEFTWQTSCDHIRKVPYDVLFKVVDNPPPNVSLAGLVDSKIWHIKVVAPAPTGFKTKVLGPNAGVEISWDPYNCNLLNPKMVIYRKKGDCEEIIQDPCTIGVVPDGYIKVAEINISDGKYIDTKGLEKNNNYVYVGMIKFTNSSAVVDYTPLTNTSCSLIPTIAPLMTNVSVQKTNQLNGENLVRWSIPKNFDQNQIAGPYYYEVLRAIGVSNPNFESITDLLPANLSGALDDTTFIDQGINTFDKVNYYKVNFYNTVNGEKALVDVSAEARNVYLVGKTTTNSVALNWFTDTPWSNEFQVHRVYRETEAGSGQFDKIADVSVGNASTFKFTDTNLIADSTYCYFVETTGKYGEGYPQFLLENASQIVCFKTVNGGNGGNDGGLDGGGGGNTLDPCTPNLISVETDCGRINQNGSCDITSFTNRLNWSLQKLETCDTNIVNYKIFYANSDSSGFNLINTVDSKLFNHEKSDEIQGCYYIQSVSSNGKTSPNSNKICVENCPNFELPNVFSPNDDGLNDRFLPLRCPLFVENIHAKIVDRYGQIVYEYDGNLSGFGWDGTNLKGNILPAETYYYQVEVLFRNSGSSNQNKSLKGWVELIK
ncbi:MAG: hypothetical protein RIR51_474 [Bacteroidota bacterium]|jgi:gliding motility-associated-like protein